MTTPLLVSLAVFNWRALKVTMVSSNLILRLRAFKYSVLESIPEHSSTCDFFFWHCCHEQNKTCWHKLGKRRFKLDPAPAFTKNNVGRLYRLQQQLIGKFSPSCLTNKARADNFLLRLIIANLLLSNLLLSALCALTYCHSPSSSSTLLTRRSATAKLRMETRLFPSLLRPCSRLHRPSLKCVD